MTREARSTARGRALLAGGCAMVVAAAAAAVVVLWAVRTGQNADARGQGLRIIPLTTFTLLGLAAVGAFATTAWGVARGRDRSAGRLGMMCAAGAAFSTGAGVVMRAPVMAVPAVALALLFLTLRQVPAAAESAAESAAAPAPTVGGSVRTVSSVEDAVQPPYPYPVPLPAEAKQAHLVAIAGWQGRITLVGLMLGLPGLVAVCISVVVGNGRSSRPGRPDLWDSRPVLAVVLFVVGALVMAVVAWAIARCARRKKRHMALLTTYGVELDQLGNEVWRPAPPRPSR